MRHLDELDGAALAEQLDTQGVAVLPGLLSASACQRLIERCNGLPALDDLGDLGDLSDLRHALYPRLQPTANRWTQAMGLPQRYPPGLQNFLASSRQSGWKEQPPTLRRLEAGDFLPAYQHADGPCVFPLQACILLSEPGVDFTGGELVLMEQRPRQQTRPIVPPLRQGDAAVFATRHRPQLGSHRRHFVSSLPPEGAAFLLGAARRRNLGTKGFYRTTLTQAVSIVRSGTRLAVDMVFHDAA